MADAVNSMGQVFAERLKDEREKVCKISRKDMAKRLGIPYETYRNYESIGSHHREPDFDTLVRIAEILETTTDYLLGKESV